MRSWSSLVEALRRHFRPLPVGLDGLPVALPFEERLARAVALVATLWFALAASWEAFGPLLAGHYASTASVGIIADNMLRWHIAGPVWEYTASRPPPSAYYCHHPWGIFWTQALITKLAGRHDVVCRLPPILLSIATPPLLYAIGRSVWRPAAGALAAASYVCLPICLAFAHFNALEVPVIAWSLLCLWGFVRFTQTWRRRWLLVSWLGLALALHADWPAYVLAAAMSTFGVARGLLLPARAFGPVNVRRYAQWWALTAVTCVLTAGLYLALFARSGKVGDLLGSAEMRSAGSQAPLSAVLAARRYWNQLMFTPVAIALGKGCALLVGARVLWSRREHEVMPLHLLVMATFQYVVFKQGADVHVFWPHYFAAYFALAMGALTATLVPLVATGAEMIARSRAASPSLPRPPTLPSLRHVAIAMVIAALPLPLVLRDAVPALRYARETGGRFNEKGLLIDSDGDKTAFLRWLSPRLSPEVIVDMHEGMKITWSQVWAFGGRLVSGNRALPKGPARDGRDAYLVDTRFAGDDAQRALAADFRVTAVGPFWWVARSDPAGPIEGWSFVEREPSALEWYFVSGTEPHRDIQPDAFVTWELRTHFGQEAPLPSEPPRTLEQRRIMHNVAVAAGDAATAAQLLAQLTGDLSAPYASYDDGTEILGTTWQPGARSLLSIYLRAGQATAADVQLGVRSRVVSRAPLSTTMADPVVREVGLPLAIAPARWKPGFIYADPVAIRRRPGTEIFHAYFRGARAPKRSDGPPEVEVLRLP
jgi:4-amino-4-deoxy-L-arabinose transferase-like glycosyltransferase